jgi:uncharacterized protein (DUF1786 family)
MVLPSPTMIVRRKIQETTKKRLPIVLSGVTMGGGPSHWAVEDHLAAGLAVYATPDAARSFNDDLDFLREQGITMVSEEEAQALGNSNPSFRLQDFDYAAIRQAFQAFGVSLDDLAAVAVAVFDHGAAPPGYSDRKFRFEYIEERVLAENRLSAFAFPSDRIPAIMTRMQAVAHSAGQVEAPLMLMDTAPAAVLGATLDPRLRSQARPMVANIGNFHTLAFRLGPTGIEGVFEHHTGFMDREKLEFLFREFAAGRLSDEFVFADQGHGARILAPTPLPLNGDHPALTVVGPRRGMIAGSGLQPYFAAPFGDMMLVGCFGLLAAAADVFPELAGRIKASLYQAGDQGSPPWELDSA